MVKKYAKLNKYLKMRKFEQVYNVLKDNSFDYSSDSIAKTFSKNNSWLMYCFLMYSISKEETIEKHLAICDYLYFYGPQINDCESLIYWHIMRALEIEKSTKVMLWVITLFSCCPDSPFSEKEIYSFAKSIYDNDASNEMVRNILLSGKTGDGLRPDE